MSTMGRQQSLFQGSPFILISWHSLRGSVSSKMMVQLVILLIQRPNLIELPVTEASKGIIISTEVTL